jgi:hypothetical protein
MGVIPLILVAGVATKMTTTMFQETATTRNRRAKRSVKRKNDSYLAKAHKALGIW